MSDWFTRNSDRLYWTSWALIYVLGLGFYLIFCMAVLEALDS